MTKNFRPALSALFVGTLGALFATGAAADVTVYGIIDTGLNYQHVDQDRAGTDATDQAQMKGSQTIPNRWGLKGTEDLGNGLTAGFMLEGQFGSDDGTMTGGRLFHRVSQLELGSDRAGTLILGRSGALRSGFGTTGIWAVKLNPFSNSWGDYLGGTKYTMPGGFKAIDNAITYRSPVWSGVQLYAQYSLKSNSSGAGTEGKASSERQWGLGATYTAGNLHLAAVVDSILYANTADDYDDSIAVSLGGHYNFGVAKVYASGMYFGGMKGSEFQGDQGKFNVLAAGATYKGASLLLAADLPAGPGTFKASMGYMSAKLDRVMGHRAEIEGDGDLDRYNVGVGYEFPLSKRTKLYAGAGWAGESSDERDPSAYEVLAGLMTRF